jgi:tetratricopeptide (TPR) repeat protein
MPKTLKVCGENGPASFDDLLTQTMAVVGSVGKGWRSHVARTLVDLAALLARLGRVERALEVAQMIEGFDDGQVPVALAAVARQQALSGDHGGAQATINTALSEISRMKDEASCEPLSIALSAIAPAQELIGDSGAAEASFRRARQVADTSQSRASHTYPPLVRGLMDTGRCSEALEVLRSEQAEGLPHDIYLDAALGCYRAGDLDGALWSATQDTDAPWRFRNLEALLKAAIANGDAASAFTVIEAVPDQDKDVALMRACEGFVAQGALEMARKAIDVWAALERSRGELAVAMAGVGDIERARETAKGAALEGDVWGQEQALAQAMARVGEVDHGLSIAQSLKKPAKQVEAEGRMLSALHAAGDTEGFRRVLETALTTARGISDKMDLVAALAEVGRVLMTLGRSAEAGEVFKEATKVATGIKAGEASMPKSFVFQHLADVQNKAGDYPGAFKSTKKIPKKEHRDSLMAFIALAYARAGDVAGAQLALENVTEDFKHFSACVEALRATHDAAESSTDGVSRE